MGVVAVVVGFALVVAVLLDLTNTLVATRSVSGRYWLTRLLYVHSWSSLRKLGRLLGERQREVVFATFAPVSALLLLSFWVSQQILGFGLIWWGIGGVSGSESLLDSIYFSGVVYFTLGFGEIVPTETIPRAGVLIEALSGVLTTALVIGYLPALYSAYSEREQKLLMLDDGSEKRMTPTSLVMSRCYGGDPRAMDSFFEGWEAWVAQVLETHSTFPMLTFFRSEQTSQNWITALGLVTDTALHLELTEGCEGRPPYWMIRRSIRLFQMLTEGVDLSEYRAALDETYATDDSAFRELYGQLGEAGFAMLPYDHAYARSRELRRKYDAELEYLIDYLEAPRGFWGHEIGHPIPKKSGLVEGEIC